MLITRYVNDVVVWAPAKVNLYLEVLAKRPDGYHELETLLVAVSLFDTLVFRARSSPEILLRCNQPNLSTGPDNLIVRAARLLQQHTGCPHGADVRLVKRIPLAAGLAGGSTDAAAALAGLNALWGLNLPPQELIGLSAQLGSDVPFFFATPAAWCTGRGEQVGALPLARRLWLVLVCPPVGMATADVYRALTVPAQPHDGASVLAALQMGDPEAIGRHLHNRLQPVAERLCPRIAEEHARLAALRPAGQLMSGSGSSLFALCRDRREALRLAQELRHGPDGQEGSRVFLVRSCS
jgi:4-diphosphocytidyl-2-C-methyl-D-erythritol kinase